MTCLRQDLLRKLTRAVSTGPIHFPQVSVTVPATGDQAFEYELRQVCERLGLTARTDLDEATAAGVYYLLRPLLLREYSRETRSDGQAATPADYYARHYGLKDDEPLHVLCVDLGGGTTDLALLRLEIQQDHRSCRVHIAVTGTSGFTELSGEGLTLFLFELLKRPFIDAGTALLPVLRDLTRRSEGRRRNGLRDTFLAELVLEIGRRDEVAETEGPLSRREREVLGHLMQGRSNREIAEVVPLSVNTVKFHLKNLFDKLGVSNRQEAVTVAIRRGLI